MISFPNAKINLGLYITEKRPDGFHNLETIFYPVGWSDALEIVSSEEHRFTTSGIHINGDPEKNLVMKAYRLLCKDFDLPKLNIHLHKQIPFGAGLGGGSSDAAHMLMLLNKSFGLAIPESKLIEYAATLGSDCAFFILNKPVFATGRGEVMNITNISLNNWWLLLVKPNVEVSTAKAFQFIKPVKNEVSLNELIQLPVEQWKGKIANQFEDSVFQQFPEIQKLQEKLYEMGAVYASMSGSGSSVFGFFSGNPLEYCNQFPANYLTFCQHL
jgi:4-diphosphocytidyl-2-C-methyl-D-erythritol kinase